MCGICGKLEPSSLCNKCKLKLKNIENTSICEYENKNFNTHIYLFQYEGIIRKAILNYKFEDKAYLNSLFMNFLENNKKIIVELQKYDIIIPVPISKKRMKERGYNQSEIMAKKIAQFLKIKYSKNILTKIKNNEVQSTLNKIDRAQNVKGVYQVKNHINLQSKKVLLVDDIFTTGSTVDECSSVLRKAGAKEVGVFTIAKD